MPARKTPQTTLGWAWWARDAAHQCRQEEALIIARLRRARDPIPEQRALAELLASLLAQEEALRLVEDVYLDLAALGEAQ